MAELIVCDRLFHDPTYKEKAWSGPHNNPLDLREICSGWVATYEIRQIQPEAILTTVQIPIAPRDMLIPIHGYLHQRFSTEIDFPLAISDDLMKFTVLERLVSLEEAQNGTGGYLLSCQLPVQSTFEMDFSWNPWTGQYIPPTSYATYFCHDRRHLALLEWRKSGGQHITVVECIPGNTLAIKVVGILNFDADIKRISKVLFHPNEAILAFCAHSMVNRGWNNGAFIWQFRKRKSAWLYFYIFF